MIQLKPSKIITWIFKRLQPRFGYIPHELQAYNNTATQQMRSEIAREAANYMLKWQQIVKKSEKMPLLVLWDGKKYSKNEGFIASRIRNIFLLNYRIEDRTWNRRNKHALEYQFFNFFSFLLLLLLLLRRHLQPLPSFGVH